MIRLLNEYLGMLHKARTNPSCDILRVAIENDYVYIIKVLHNAGLSLYAEDLEFAKSMGSKLTITYLSSFSYLPRMQKDSSVNNS